MKMTNLCPCTSLLADSWYSNLRLRLCIFYCLIVSPNIITSWFVFNLCPRDSTECNGIIALGLVCLVASPRKPDTQDMASLPFLPSIYVSMLSFLPSIFICLLFQEAFHDDQRNISFLLSIQN